MSLSSRSALHIEVGRESMVLTDGLQPFVTRVSPRVLWCQAQLSFQPGYVRPESNAFPGVPGNIISHDGGESWQRWKPQLDRALLRELSTELARPEVGILKSESAAAGLEQDAEARMARGEGPVMEGCAARLADGRLLIVSWIAEGPDSHGQWRGKFWESRDDLTSVAGPLPMVIDLPQARVGFDDGGHPYSGLTFHRTLLQLPNGDLLASAYCWFEGDTDPVPYQPNACKWRVILLRSMDRGRHWHYLATVGYLPTSEEGCNEPTLVRMTGGSSQGELVCLVRTGCHDSALHLARSGDDGATWSPLETLPFKGVDPDLQELHDGTLVLSFGHRTLHWSSRPTPEHGNYVVFSRDAGHNWEALTKLPLGDQPATNHTTCYTTVREMEPGRLLVWYDIGDWIQPVRYVAQCEVRIKS